jgi:hypothetical protein
VFDHLKDPFNMSYIAKNKKNIFRLQWAVTVEWKIGSWAMGDIQVQ